MRTLCELLSQACYQLSETSASAQLDAEVLLAYTLDKDRSFLRAWPETVLQTRQQEDYQEKINQRRSGIPVAYLTGVREFWSRLFKVSTDVLIPRPETELLIEHSLQLIDQQDIRQIVDVGTGSGIIAVTLAAERPQVRIIAIDLSWQALSVARENAQTHRVDQRIDFIQSSWLQGVSDHSQPLIISNPPYIAETDPHLRHEDIRFEPGLALISGEKGLDALTTLALQAKGKLIPGGHLILEHGYNQTHDLKHILSTHGFSELKFHTDFSDHMRVAIAQLKVES